MGKAKEKNTTLLEFVSAMQEIYPETADIKKLNRLWKISRVLKLIAEKECNENLTERDEKQREGLEAEAQQISDGMGVPVSFGEDARLSSILFKVTASRWNCRSCWEPNGHYWGIDGFDVNETR